jgi:hypothetical protein
MLLDQVLWAGLLGGVTGDSARPYLRNETPVAA